MTQLKRFFKLQKQAVTSELARPVKIWIGDDWEVMEDIRLDKQETGIFLTFTTPCDTEISFDRKAALEFKQLLEAYLEVIK